MSSIDERIVSMQFDNQAFEKNVGTSLDSLKKLESSVDGLNGLNTDRLSDQIGNISERFSTLGIIGMTALENITNRFVDMGIKFAKSLTIDQVMSGFEKYTANTKTIKALLNSTGETIDVVNEKINALSWYSDATSYSYNAMVSALKSFTAQDIKMDEAIPAIMGIGNSLSYAGLAAEESSYAFDLYSKAIGQGYLSNIQWKSLNNMGAATANLKQQFIDAAVAEKKLIKVGDGLYRTQQGLNVSIRDFDMTLGHQKGKWLTREVMMRVFNDVYGTYTQRLQAFMAQEENAGMTIDQAIKKFNDLNGITEDFGLKAFKAAQEARTFNEAIGAIRDAASSAWRGIFENVFGNAEEATLMWTSFSDWLYDVFMGPSEMMYNLTTEWKRLGGREGMLQGFANLAEALDSFVQPIKQAFRSIFGEITASSLGKALKDLTDKFVELTAKLKLNTPTLVKVREIFQGIFTVFAIIKDVIVEVAKGFGTILEHLKPLSSSLLDASASFGEWLTNHRYFLKTKDGVISGFGELVGKLIDFVANAKPVEAIFSKIKSLAETLGEKLVELGTNLKNTFSPIVDKNLNFENILKLIAALGGAQAIKVTVFDRLKNLGSLPSNIAGTISTALKAVSDSMREWGMIDVSAKQMKDIAIALAILAGSLYLIASIDTGKLMGGLIGIEAMIKMMEGVIISFSKMKFGLKSSSSFAALGAALIEISLALLVMSAAVKNISGLDFEQMITGISGIGAVMFELSLFAKSLKTTSITPKTGLAMILIATSLLIMSKGVEVIGTIPIDTLKQGLMGIAAILVEIGVFSRLLDPTGMVSTSIAMVILGGAILVIGKAIQMIGSLPFEVVIQGLTGMAGALTVMGIALKLIPGDLAVAGSIAIMALGMIELAAAFKIMADIPIEAIGVALAGILPTLGAAFVLFKFLDPVKTIAISAALVIFAAAINLLVPAFYALGNLKLEQIGIALLAIVGSLAVLGGMAFLLQSLIVPMLGLAAAMALFGIGVAAFGAGMATLAASGTVAAASLVGSLQIILTAIPMLGASIMKAITALIVAFCGAVIASGPVLLNTIGVTIESILTFLLEKMPKFIDMGMEIVISLIEGITKKLPRLVDAAVTMITTFLDSLAKSLKKNKDTLVKAIDDLILTIFDIVWEAITGLLKMITDRIPEIWQKAKDFIGGFLMGIIEKGAEINQKMWDIVDQAGEAIEKKFDEIKQWGANIFNKIKEGLVSAFEAPITGIKNIATNLINGFKNGLDDPTTQNSLMAKVGGVGSKILGKFRDVLGIASPSKETELLAEWMMKGFVVGIDSTTFEAEEEAAEAAEKILEAFGDPLAEMINKLEADVEMNPTITPVLDLTDFDAGIEHMGSGLSMVQEIIGDVKAENQIASWQEKYKAWKAGGAKAEDLTYEIASGGSSKTVAYGTAGGTLDMVAAAAGGFLNKAGREFWKQNATDADKTRLDALEAAKKPVYGIVQYINSPDPADPAEVYRATSNAVKDVTAKDAINRTFSHITNNVVLNS